MAEGSVSDKKNTGIKVTLDAARIRQSPDSGAIFKEGLQRTAGAAMTAANTVAPYVPGMAVVSAAITGMGALKDATGASATAANTASNATQVSFSGASGMSGGAGRAGASSGAFNNIEAAAAAGDSGAQQLLATREMQAMNHSMNAQYLMLQNEMQAENRQFSVMSNIMKLRHETAKNSISNFR
jgi:hypothetical protein